MDEIKLPREAAQCVFDALCNSMDFGSGFLDTEDVDALRTLAEAIGVDPAVGTPDSFKSQYPHTFEPANDPDFVAQMFGALEQDVAYATTGTPVAATRIDSAKMPDFVPCKVGTYALRCMKPADHEVHRG